MTDTSPAALRAVLDDLDEFVPRLREAATAIERHAWDGTSQDAALCSSMASAAADNLDLVMGLLRALAAEKGAGAPAPDGWIPWEGGECPVGGDVMVCVLFRGQTEVYAPSPAGNLRWGHHKSTADIIAYRVAKEG